MVPNYGESDILTLPEQIIPICERLASLGVTSVVNKLLFWGKLHEVKFHSLGLISASLQLKELIDSICQAAISLMWAQKQSCRVGLLSLREWSMCVSVEGKDVQG